MSPNTAAGPSPQNNDMSKLIKDDTQSCLDWSPLEAERSPLGSGRPQGFALDRAGRGRTVLDRLVLLGLHWGSLGMSSMSSMLSVLSMMGPVCCMLSMVSAMSGLCRMFGMLLAVLAVLSMVTMLAVVGVVQISHDKRNHH